jgi:hypothetical protein
MCDFLNSRSKFLNPIISAVIEEEIRFYSNANVLMMRLIGMRERLESLDNSIPQTSCSNYDPSKFIRGHSLLLNKTNQEITTQTVVYNNIGENVNGNVIVENINNNNLNNFNNLNTNTNIIPNIPIITENVITTIPQPTTTTTIPERINIVTENPIIEQPRTIITIPENPVLKINTNENEFRIKTKSLDESYFTEDEVETSNKKTGLISERTDMPIHYGEEYRDTIPTTIEIPPLETNKDIISSVRPTNNIREQEVFTSTMTANEYINNQNNQNIINKQVISPTSYENNANIINQINKAGSTDEVKSVNVMNVSSKSYSNEYKEEFYYSSTGNELLKVRINIKTKEKESM